MKTQWLNKIFIFNEAHYRFINMVVNKDGDLILETSTEEIDKRRLFFRLKGNGSFYFKDENNKEVMTRTIEVLDNNNEAAQRYESQAFLIRINNNDSDEKKELLVSISLYLGFMEIYDINDNNIPFSKIKVTDYSYYTIFSKKGSIIGLNDNECLYCYIGRKDQNTNDFYFVIDKYSFKNSNIINQVIKNDNFFILIQKKHLEQNCQEI